jgi:hypothetical protein
MTFKPLTADRGEAVLMSYLEAFPVKTSPQREKEQELKASEAECGEKCHGWLAKFDPNTSTLRTAQCSLLEEEPELLQTLPRSGMTRSGMLWERQTLVLRTCETESGLWPTPVLDDTGQRKKKYAQGGTPLSLAVNTWPTPRTKGMCGGTGSWELLKKNTTIEEARQMGAGNGGKLNPTWVEWLMGWPLGWTDLKPLEMDKFQQWQQQHGSY